MILSRIKICVIISMQIVIICCQDGHKNEAGGEAKLLTEKTCKFDQEAGPDHSKLNRDIFLYRCFRFEIISNP